MTCAREIAALAVHPHRVLPVLKCEGCGYSVAADVRNGRWTCPRPDCQVTNLQTKEH